MVQVIDALEKLNRLLVRRASRFAPLLLIVYVGFLGIVGVKTTLISTNAEHQIVRPNLLFDDGGVYTAEAIALANWDTLSKSDWFSSIKEGISREDLARNWGYYAPRVKFIFSRGIRDGWLLLLGLIAQVTDSFENALAISIIIFPLFVLVKYLLLWVYWARNNCVANAATLILVSIMILEVGQPFGSLHYWFVTSAYGMLFFSAALMVRFFIRRKPDEQSASVQFYVLFYILLLLSIAFSQTVLPVALGFVAIDLLRANKRRYESLSELCRANFIRISIGGILMILPIAAVLAVSQLAIDSSSVNLVVQLNEFRLEYLSLVTLGLIGTYAFQLNSNANLSSAPTDKDEESRVLLLSIVAVIVMVVGLIICAPLLDPETQHNVHRINPYLFSILVIANLRLALINDNLFSRVLVSTMLIAALAIGVDKYRSPLIWKVTRNQPFSSSDFPEQLRSESGTRYFLASNPQQVYGYFIANSFNDGPLVLNIKTETYDGAKVVESIDRQGR